MDMNNISVSIPDSITSDFGDIDIDVRKCQDDLQTCANALSPYGMLKCSTTAIIEHAAKIAAAQEQLKLLFETMTAYAPSEFRRLLNRFKTEVKRCRILKCPQTFHSNLTLLQIERSLQRNKHRPKSSRIFPFLCHHSHR